MSSKTTRVLVVEDQPDYARFLREVLLEAKDDSTVTYEVTTASTLEEGVALLRAGTFDIVLLDLGLPDADETEALTQALEVAPSTPIVVLSALSDLGVALESMRLGAQEYLVKGQAEHLILPRAVRYAMERKRLQDVLANAQAEAVRANAVKDEFLAMLGHELRNPLAPIVTGLTLMKAHGGNAIARELQVVERQVNHLIRLVDDLLDVARITRGKMLLERRRVDLAEVIATSIETVEPLLDEKRHTLTIDAPKDVLFVNGDQERLAQVVANLLSNAAKYTPAGGKLAVRGQLVSAGAASASSEPMVELRVQDTGIGMSEDLIARVFELFEQGERTPDRSAGGLGLGLAIVRNIVTLHGGKIHATSGGLSKGSELVVQLPFAPAQTEAQPQPQGIQPAAAAQDTTEKKERASAIPSTPRAMSKPRARKVLIVDDNEDAADLLAFSLEQVGHETRTANDGPTALKEAEAFLPDVALLDIGLPIWDGHEVARRMKASLGDRAPVLIALTGYGRESDRERSRAAGFGHHLVKPIDLAALQKLIGELGD